MDLADQELRRVIRASHEVFPSMNWDTAACQDVDAKHCQWQRDQRSASDTLKEFYFLDNHGINDHGDTSLHRLLALHTPPGALLQYFQRIKEHKSVLRRDQTPVSDDGGLLDKTMIFENHPDPPCLDQVNQLGVNALHVAIFRNSWGVEPLVKTLLEQTGPHSQSLASMPMRSGSYPLHILAGHNMTICRNVLVSLLESDPSVVLKDDVHGDNPFSLLWKNVLRFRWSLNMEQGKSDHVEYGDQRMSWMTVISPDQYLDYSLLMLRAALKSLNHPSWNADEVTLSDICQMPRCPPLLVRMALSGYQHANTTIAGSVYSIDGNGMLPLHHAARSKVATLRFLPPLLVGERPLPSVLELLLTVNPAGATVLDHRGRLPLHYALENNTITDKSVMDLIKCYPESLRIQDPVTRLYPFQLCASRPCCQNRNGLANEPFIRSTTSTGQADTHEGDRKSSESLAYLILQLCPEAVIYRGSIHSHEQVPAALSTPT